MLYLFLSQNHIKLLYVRKTLLGQYESAFYEKKHTVDFLDANGSVVNTDLLASAIKEATNSISPNGVKEKDTCLILPHASFQYMRAEVPADVAPTAISSFVKDKARSALPKDIENYHYDFLIQDNEKQKQIIFFAMDKDVLKVFQEALTLVDLQINSIVPDSLGYFKLFEKTLRKEKKENILYAVYDKDQMFAYLYDSHGPVENSYWKEPIVDEASAEEVLKKKTAEYEAEGKKLNRLILSGENSDTIRQDTFTKNVGVWTNPLKRIIPQFYQDYLKIFIIPSDKTLPLLQYDICIGAFIFSLENKGFSLLKKKFGSFSAPSLSAPKFNITKKDLGLFTGSFLLSLLVFMLFSNFNPASLLPSEGLGTFATKPTPTPTVPPPSPTPTVPPVNKEELRIMVRNGSGVKGKATEVKDLLIEKEYTGVILTENADNFDYTTTEIQIKKDKKQLESIIKKDLSDHVASPKVTVLDAEEASDIIIIFGSDFK